MLSENNHAGGRGASTPPSDLGRAPPDRAPPPGSGEAWGWELVQCDWSLRQREPARPASAFAGLLARAGAAIARVRRLARVALRGIVHGTARLDGQP